MAVIFLNSRESVRSKELVVWKEAGCDGTAHITGLSADPEWAERLGVKSIPCQGACLSDFTARSGYKVTYMFSDLCVPPMSVPSKCWVKDHLH